MGKELMSRSLPQGKVGSVVNGQQKCRNLISVTALSQGTTGSQHKSPEFFHKMRENVPYSDPRGLLGTPPRKVSVLEDEVFLKSNFSEVNTPDMTMDRDQDD